MLLERKRSFAWMLGALTLAGPVAAMPALAFDDPPAAQKIDLGPLLPPADPADAEMRLGRENADANDKQVKLVNDPEIVGRVNRIGQEIAEVANRYVLDATWGTKQTKSFKYIFKVVDDKDVNAYSLPGGYIYVNKGLIDLVRSDDELAGVLAHEVAHAAHHHVMKLIKEEGKLNKGLMPLQLALLALIIAGGSGNGSRTTADAGNIMSGLQLYAIARTNGYGIEAEKDADKTGIYLLTKTKYNPVGLYSFMIKLAKRERVTGGIDFGIYRTHPPSDQRVASAEANLNTLKIPIVLADVDPTLRPFVTVVTDERGNSVAEVHMQNLLLGRVVASDTQSAEERGNAMSKRLNTLLNSGLQPFEIMPNRDQSAVTARGQALLSKEDAAAMSKSIPEMAQLLAQNIARVKQKRALESGI